LDFWTRHEGIVRAGPALFGLLLIVFAAGAQDTNLLLKLDPVPPFPELRAAATADGIPVDGIVPSKSSNSLAAGDSLTALITLHQKGKTRTEWLVYFQVTPATNELAAKPPKPEVLYNSAGDKFEFGRSPVVFCIRTLGPYVETKSFFGKPAAKDNTAQVSVNGEFLNLGLDKGAAAIHRLYHAHGTNFNFWVRPRPPASKEALKNQAIAAALKVTPEEKRALAGWFPALMCYFNAVGETPDLDTIMWKVVSLPSMWSIVRHVGVTARMGMDFDNIRPLSLPAPWGIPDSPNVFTLPINIELNRQPALNATLFAADPHPALLTCGGIVGFVAQNPNDAQNYATLRVISTRSSSGAKKK
jgi:hypothetical protein